MMGRLVIGSPDRVLLALLVDERDADAANGLHGFGGATPAWLRLWLTCLLLPCSVSQ